MRRPARWGRRARPRAPPLPGPDAEIGGRLAGGGRARADLQGPHEAREDPPRLRRGFPRGCGALPGGGPGGRARCGCIRAEARDQRPRARPAGPDERAGTARWRRSGGGAHAGAARLGPSRAATRRPRPRARGRAMTTPPPPPPPPRRPYWLLPAFAVMLVAPGWTVPVLVGTALAAMAWRAASAVARRSARTPDPAGGILLGADERRRGVV